MASKKQVPQSGFISIIGLIILVALAASWFTGSSTSNKHQQYNANTATSKAIRDSQHSVSQPATTASQKGQPDTNQAQTGLAQLNFNGQQIIQVNNGQPNFTAEQLNTTHGAWATYQPLDNLGRATGASALLNKSLMPHAKRQRLTVNPTGFKNRKVPINGHIEWLYNRSHLIGYQFTGQNNNLQNLVTGTRSLNDPGMSYYENMVASYLKSHPNDYVRYQVTPYYRAQELVPRGVQMQAESIGSQTIRFNLYIFNVQSGVNINYQNGYSSTN
ncbi:DNA/RNA non-specific endonuclease [Periweissella fabalis]|uniref:DNA/RNA non-specific endonuclease n=1 Tax=Periweissella fabalis TaxID=1070421 RepID=A0A7X6N6B9_9LACO|nr:DNA/RNA non-specific endonuclease [Periweissella fabalis]MCM0598232.1 DNA/RNA non-specific endonuclease [Periweissella fabalis]NKZ24833.1 DNA/RNA non-specific endonuclease [Periweissella fabalis]